MPSDVIDRVHKMSRRDEAEITLYFATKRGPIGDEIHDDVDDYTLFDPANNDSTDEDDDDDAAPVHIVLGVNDEPRDDNSDEEGGDEYNPDIIENEPHEGHEGNDEDNEPHEGHEGNDEDNPEATEPGNRLNENTAEPNNEEEVDEEPTSIEQRIQQMNAAYGHRQHKYNLRARKPCDYSHLHATLEGIVMTQHNVKKGLQVFGEAGMEAVLKELNQLHERGVLEPKKHLLHEQSREALQCIPYVSETKTQCEQLKVVAVLMVGSNVSTQPRKKLALQLLQLNQSCCHACLMR